MSTGLSRDGRRPASSRRAARGRVPSIGVVAEVAAQLVPGGLVLPASSIFGPTGFPVVAVDKGQAAARRTADSPPVVRTEELARRLEAGESLPATPVTLLAFVSGTTPDRAVRELGLVRPYCRTILLVDRDDVGEPVLSEFDYWGITVVAADPVEVLVPGDPGPAAGSDLAHAWAVLRGEQLYAAALAAGAC